MTQDSEDDAVIGSVSYGASDADVSAGTGDDGIDGGNGDPVVTATVSGDGLAQVTIDGTAHPVSGASVSASRENVVRFIAARVASELGRAIQVPVADPEGQLMLLIHPNATVEVLPPPSRRAARRRSEGSGVSAEDTAATTGSGSATSSTTASSSSASLGSVSLGSASSSSASLGSASLGSASLSSEREAPTAASLEAVSAELTALPPVLSGLPIQRQPHEFVPQDAATEEFSAVRRGPIDGSDVIKSADQTSRVEESPVATTGGDATVDGTQSEHSQSEHSQSGQVPAAPALRTRPSSSLALSALEPLAAPRPVNISPRVVESKVVEPRVVEPKVAEPEAAEPEAAEPEAAESNEVVSDQSGIDDISSVQSAFAEQPIELFTHEQHSDVMPIPATDFPPAFAPLPQADADTFPVSSHPTPLPVEQVSVPTPSPHHLPAPTSPTNISPVTPVVVRRHAVEEHPPPTSAPPSAESSIPKPSGPDPTRALPTRALPTGALPTIDPSTGALPTTPAPDQQPRRSGHHATPPTAAASTPELPTLDSLLAGRPAPAGGPAHMGWQATVRRLTGGAISPKAGPVEVKHREAIASVQRSLRGPKTVVVVNPKGGAHKTTATLLIAATFGIHRGGYTLAWDNNETRGTLGWRAAQTRHTNTAVDLLRDLERFQDARGARVGDLDNYVRTQGNAQFDVLASDEDAASAASIDGDAFLALHTSLARFYRILVVDTGNNMRASNWQAAVNKADQLVIVSTIREDTAQSAAWLLDGLRAAGQEEAVHNAVTVLSAPAKNIDRELSARLHTHFGQLTRTVLDVPHDPALVAGGPVDVERLADSTRESWLHVTAAVAEGL